MASIVGTSGDDQFGTSIFGTDQNDTLRGLAGNDFLFGSGGSDEMDGGDDFDAAIYDFGFAGGLVINNTSAERGGAAPFTVIKSGVGIDRLVGIEAFNASQAADVVFTRGGYVFDRGGDDRVTFVGVGGGFIAGSGNDVYASASGGASLQYSSDDFDAAGPRSRGVDLAMTGAGVGTSVDPWGFIDSFSGVAEISGSNLADVMRGGGGDDRFFGAAGDDSLTGGEGDDLLKGDAGDDTLRGEAGDDVLQSSDGDDILDGGDGDDDFANYFEDQHEGGFAPVAGVYVNNSDEARDGVAAFTTDKRGLGVDTLIDIENVIGTNGDDVIVLGDDLVDDDDARRPFVDARDGDDRVDVGDEGAFVFLGRGADTLIANVGDGTAIAFDRLDVARGVEIALADDVTVFVDPYGDTDRVIGVDRVVGTPFDDILRGDASDNRFDGEDGDDLLEGGDGNDRLEGGRGDDAIDGGAGDRDRLDYRDSVAGSEVAATQGVTLTFDGVGSGSAIDGWGDTDVFRGIERVDGSAFDDTLTGAEGDETLRGEGGDDVIDGGLGDNRLEGGAGDDRITSRGAGDFVAGGDGDDTITVLGPDATVAPGLGDDTVIGSAAPFSTTLRYEDVLTPVTVDLAVGETVGVGFRDVFSNVHRASGGDGDDTLLGGANDEYEAFDDSRGADFIDGRGGFDELIFNIGELGDLPIVIDFAAGEVRDTFGTIDRFANIEAVRATPGADSATGSGQAFERYRLLAGDDTLNGGGGVDETDHSRDAFYGGGGDVTVDLAAGFAIDGWGDRDALSGVENARGGDGDDRLTGDGGSNHLRGLGGDDTLDGGGGDDALEGGLGVDDLMLGAGEDTVRGTLAELDGDVLRDFGPEDVLALRDGDGAAVAATLRASGGKLLIDVDGDGVAEATMTLADGYAGPVRQEGAPPIDPVGLALDGAGFFAATAIEGDPDGDGGVLRFSVRRTGDTDVALTARLAVEGFGLAGASDLDLENGLPATVEIDFAAGQRVATVDIRIAPDERPEDDETVAVRLADAAAADGRLVRVDPSAALGRILDDDAAFARVTVTGGQAAEGAPARFVFARDGGPLDAPLTVFWTLEGGPLFRQANADDVAGGLPAEGAVVIPAGAASAVLEVATREDAVIEANETMVLRVLALDDPSGAFGIGARQASWRIMNDDGIPDAPPPGFGANVFGDPHIVTFDGRGYSFQAVGEFVLFESAPGAADPIQVQARFSALPGSDLVSVTTAIATTIGERRVTVDAASADPLRVDGVVADAAGGLDLDGDGTTDILFDGDAFTLVLPSGEQLVLTLADGSLNVSAALAASRAGALRGLMGDADGDAGDDLTARDGVAADPEALYGSFADSWRVDDPAAGAGAGKDSLFDYPDGQSTADFTEQGFPRGAFSLDDLPAPLREAALAAAEEAGVDPALRAFAALDFALTGDASFLAGAAAAATPLVVDAPPRAGPVVVAVSVAATAAALDEATAAAQGLSFTIFRTGDPSAPMSVAYALDGDVEPADFASGAALSGVAEFAVGQTATTITLAFADDHAAEGDEKAAIRIALLDGVGAVVAGAVAGTTIVDDDFAPLARDDVARTSAGTAVTIDALANDRDADGDTLSFVSATAATGAVAIVDAALVYTPAAGFAGEDTISYVVSDGVNASSAAVAVTVAEPSGETIVGTARRDTLRGADGDDVLLSGGGAVDRMSGAGGADRFVYQTVDGRRDIAIVLDYDEAEGDVIDLDGADIADITTVGRSLYLRLEGPERDLLLIRGVQDADDVTFL